MGKKNNRDNNPKRKILDSMLLMHIGLTLQCLHSTLEDWETIDEDKTWLWTLQGPPPKRPKKGPRHALKNLDQIRLMMGKVSCLTSALSPSFQPLKSDVEIITAVCSECFGIDIDQVVEFHMYRNELKLASDHCKGATGRAFEYCGKELRMLSARCLNAFSQMFPDGLNGEVVDHELHIDETFFRNENSLGKRLHQLIARIDTPNKPDEELLVKVREALKQHGRNATVETIRQAVKKRTDTVAKALRYLETLGEYASRGIMGNFPENSPHTRRLE